MIILIIQWAVLVQSIVTKTLVPTRVEADPTDFCGIIFIIKKKRKLWKGSGLVDLAV